VTLPAATAPPAGATATTAGAAAATAGATGASTLGGRLRSWWPWFAIVGGLLAAGLLAGAPAPEGPPLDPTSTGPAGTKALVDTLRDLGAQVDVQSEPPGPSATTALLLDDRLDDAARTQVVDWVAAGGTLVVTDVGSPLNPGHPSASAAIAFLDPELHKHCSVAALSRVERIDAPDAILQDVPDGGTGCFTVGGQSWLVIVPHGEGNVVSLGGAGALVNGRLGKADNALLAADLLAPTASDHVVVLRPPALGEGDVSLRDLVAPRVKLALVQVAIAFVVLALWRARRLGRPVLEPQPVQLPASDLVVAVGGLMQRAKGRDQASTVLREDLRRALAERLGLPPTTPAAVVADAVAATSQSGRRAEGVLAVLTGPAPVSEDGLVLLAQQVESIRRNP
jgi:hypothetical protein